MQLRLSSLSFITRWATVACTVVLTGCALMPTPGGAGTAPTSTAPRCDGAPSTADATRLTAIEQLLDQGKSYAALAQLDAAALPTVRAEHLRAEALRRTGDTASASAAYQALLHSCMAGQAHHGLGRIAAEQGRLPEALRHLQQARHALPTDPRVRSDFGYALLLAGQLERARVEFLTALDLQPAEDRAARNLVLLTFRQGDGPQAESLARRFGLPPAVVAGLRQQASAMASAPANATSSAGT